VKTKAKQSKQVIDLYEFFPFSFAFSFSPILLKFFYVQESPKWEKRLGENPQWEKRACCLYGN